MKVPVVAALLSLSACSFDPGGRAVDDASPSGEVDGAAVDAASADARPVPVDAPVVPVDAPVDAPVFDTARCPAEYVGTGRSRYRTVISFGQSWGAAERDCRDDAPGLTHLWVPDDEAEILAVDASLCGPGQCYYGWLGLVYSPEGAWRTVTGQPAYLRWDEDQPNNLDEPGPIVVGLNPNRHAMVDAPADRNYGTVCECDGRGASLPLP